MNTQFKFTNKNIATLPPHSKDSKTTEQEYSDTQVSGFKVLVGKSNSKKFLLRYTLRKRKCSVALGFFGVVTVEEARLMANRYKALIAQGRDPRQEREEFKNRIKSPQTYHQSCRY